MRTNRQLFEQVLKNFEGRADSAISIPLYYSESTYPGGCAVGCLVSLKDRQALQVLADDNLSYIISSLIKLDIPELASLREYSVEGLASIQALHDRSGTIAVFRGLVVAALEAGYAEPGRGFGYIPKIFMDETPVVEFDDASDCDGGFSDGGY